MVAETKTKLGVGAYLLNQPFNLIFSPFLLISCIDDDFFPLVKEGIVRLSHNNTIAIRTASLIVDSVVVFEFFRTIHDDSVNDR